MILEAERVSIQAPTSWSPAAAQSFNFSAGEHLFHEGDDAHSLYEVQEGVVIIYRTAVDGGRQLFGIRFAGDLLAISGRDQHYCSALAVRFTRVDRISRAQMDQSIDADPKLGRRLLNACRSELLRTREQLMIVGSRSALGRVAALLVDLANRAGDHGAAVTLPLTRSEMGDYLGLTIETVSRAMSRLTALKIIALPRSDKVLIVNRARLNDLATGLDEGAARGRIMA